MWMEENFTRVDSTEIDERRIISIRSVDCILKDVLVDHEFDDL